MNISFTKEEKIELLRVVGYEIKIVPSWNYEWDFDEMCNYKVSLNVTIAVKGEEVPPDKLLKGEATYLEREFGLDIVFYSELKSRIKNLFFEPNYE